MEPIRTPWSQRVARFRRQHLPVAVWLGAVAAIVVLLVARGQSFEYVGLAQAATYEISPAAVGTLERVLVEPYDEVEPGDVVAVLDATRVEGAIATARATLQQLSAELDAARARYRSTAGQDRAGWRADLHRIQTDEEERRLAGLELRVTIEADEVALERLRLETERAARLHAEGLVPELEWERVRLLRDETAKRIEQNRLLAARIDEEYRAARARRESFEAGLPASAEPGSLLAPLREAIEVESRRLAEIELERESLVLRSPVAGQVHQILCRSGQSVVAGEPIATITERAAREIVAWLDESDGRTVEPRSRVVLAAATRPDRLVESFVVRVGTGYELLPERLWVDPALPSWGRAVVIAAGPEMRLLPGERVDVRFRDR